MPQLKSHRFPDFADSIIRCSLLCSPRPSLRPPFPRDDSRRPVQSGDEQIAGHGPAHSQINDDQNRRTQGSEGEDDRNDQQ
jgi:hypothetical protein